MPAYSADDVRTLATKIDALPLSPGERAVLDALFGGPGDAEVEGFAKTSLPDQMATSFATGFKVEIEGFTAPGDVAGFTAPGDVAGMKAR